MKAILITLLLAGSQLLAQTTASIEEGEQTLTWIGKAAVGNYAPEGTIEILNAEIEYTSNSIEKLSLVVDMRTLAQENTQLQDHLKEKDFFHVKKFPVASFILSERVSIENSEVIISGKMTIRGQAQTENIYGQIKVDKDEGTLTFAFDHKMDRTKYGVNHNSPSLFKKLKENAIADDFVLKGSITFKNN